MNSQRAPKDLRNDRRGAVLLIAVFMSAFLVGCLWYVIGIGDAAIYRQYMQDGADAVAFGSAVYHARGMNIIALINLVMAAVLMVLVAFKIGQVLLIAANIISCMFPLNPICAMTSAAQTPYANLVMKVEKIVDTILKALYQASNAVAIGMPWVAEGKAILVSKDYAPTVDGGFMASISLLPGPVEQAVGGLVAKDKKATATGGSTDTKKSKSGAMRWGLPVQDDDFSVLCGKAGKNVVSFVFLPFDFLPGFGGLAKGVSKFAGGVVGKITSTFPGYFCGDLKDAAKGFADTIKDAVTDKADAKLEDLCKKKAKDAKDDKVDFDLKACLDASKGGLEKLGKPGGPTLGEGKTSKKVYDAATLGDDYFAVWSFDWGNLQDQSDAAKGVNVAGWNKAKAAGPSTFTKFGIAKAEFYYEPKPGDPKKWGKEFSETLPLGLAPDEKEGGLSTDAMWNMRWRARLRRVRLPVPSAGGILASKLNSKIKVPIIGDMLQWPAGKLGDMVDDKVREVIGAITSGVITH